jgi:hypothetical protein
MNQAAQILWTKAEKIALRAFAFYMIFYVLFLSDYSSLLHLNFISAGLTDGINKLFIHKEFHGFIPTTDSYWAFMASLIFFILAIVISLTWTLFEKGKSFPVFIKCAYILARYYLAFSLVQYGVAKLDGLQFSILPTRLVQPVGSTDSFNLYWMSMGVSKSYSFFAGLLETKAGILLLFRRTETLGCVMAIPVLLNVLMINIAYDIWVKLIVFHLLCFGIFILIPDIKRLFKFIILKQSTSLSLTLPPLIKNKNFRWLQYTVKFLFIAYIVFITSIKNDLDALNRIHNSPFQNLVGIFEVKGFSINKSNSSDPSDWKKLAFNQFNYLQVLLKNDSVSGYVFEPDLANRIVSLKSLSDTAIKVKLHYMETKSNEWLFYGTYKSDSIRFSASKIDMYSLPLLKDRGKIKWTYD